MKTNTIHQKTASFISIFIALFILASCSEEIEFELKEAAPQLVVEASVPESQYAEVVLSTTVNVNAKESDKFVSGAIVLLEDEKGNHETLKEATPGHYLSTSIKGTPKTNYKLRIETDNQVKEITSQDKMPTPVMISRLRVRDSNLPGIDGIAIPSWEVIVDYNDPVNETNYYRFVEYINGEVKAHYVQNDTYITGERNKSYLTSTTRKLVSGDEVTVEMQSISKAVYDYFYGFSLLNSVTQGTSVVNPVTNVTGVKLGYFSAHTVSRKSIIVP